MISHGRWFSPGAPDSSTTKTGRHDIAKIVLNVASKHQKLKNKSPRGTLGSLASLLAAILNIGNHDRNHKSEMHTLYAVAAWMLLHITKVHNGWIKILSTPHCQLSGVGQSMKLNYLYMVSFIASSLWWPCFSSTMYLYSDCPFGIFKLFFTFNVACVVKHIYFIYPCIYIQLKK